jgi:hypothetical protein
VGVVVAVVLILVRVRELLMVVVTALDRVHFGHITAGVGLGVLLTLGGG